MPQTRAQREHQLRERTPKRCGYTHSGAARHRQLYSPGTAAASTAAAVAAVATAHTTARTTGLVCSSDALPATGTRRAAARSAQSRAATSSEQTRARSAARREGWLQAKLLGPFRDLSSGLSHLGETGGWVRLRDERFGGAPKGGLGGGGEGWKLRPTSLPGAGSELSRNLHPGEGWMLLSGAKIGLGVLLAPVDDRAAREVHITACAVSVNGVSSQPAAVNRCGGTACARRRTPRSARARVVLRVASASPQISPDLPRSPHRWSADWQASGGACRALRFGGGLLGRSPPNLPVSRLASCGAGS